MSGIIGVDEAGRGPVFGSLFVAAVAAESTAVLPDGVADSKALSPARRSELATMLATDAGIDIAVVEVTPDRIDASHTTLLDIVAQSFAAVIDKVWMPSMEVVTDTGEANTTRFADRVQQHLDHDIDITALVKADISEPIVSAASIIAKERREQHIARLQERFGDIGSGYPSDPTTRAYLASYLDEHGDLPPIARQSWQTCQDAIAAYEQASFDRFLATGDD